jgi:endonuclease/exonuclease/phosphatase family metal-dependent hydrolase
MWRKTQRFLATFVPALLLLGYLAVAVCLWNRWDAVVAATLVPVWAWAGAGALVSLLCWIACRRAALGALFALFLATGVVFAEESRSLLREFVATLGSAPEPTSGESSEAAPATEAPAIRLANVRCGKGGADLRESALREAARARPDVIAVQEAPERAALESVADELWGVSRSVTVVGDLAVIAEGEALAVLGEAGSGALHVRLRRPDGLVLDITSLDLAGCAPRRDMWRPEVWWELVEARVETRRLVRTHLGENPISPEKVHRVVCGGFGTPPGDDAFRPLENSGMVDTFAVAGQGWGNTYPSDFPLLRLDQIWVSANLPPLKSTTRLNSASRHRIVVSEVRPPAR